MCEKENVHIESCEKPEVRVFCKPSIFFLLKGKVSEICYEWGYVNVDFHSLSCTLVFVLNV